MSTQRWDRIWIVSGVVLALIIAAVTWFGFVSPQLADKSDSQQQTEDAQAHNLTLQHKVDDLKRQSEQSDELKQQLADVRTEVPTRHSLDAFTRQLTKQATDAKVQLISIVPGQPVQVKLPNAQPKPSTAPTEGAAEPGSDPAQTESTAPAQSAVGNVYSLNVALSAKGTMADLRTFLALIEQQGPRRALVTNTSFSPADESAPDDSDSTQPKQGDDAADNAAQGDNADAEAAQSDDTSNKDKAADQQWALSLQLQVFVAPQSAEQEAELHKELGGNG